MHAPDTAAPSEPTSLSPRSPAIARPLPDLADACRREPRLSDVLADPVVLAVMRADHVDPATLRASLGEMAARLGPAGRSALPRL